MDFTTVKKDCFAFKIGKSHPLCSVLTDMVCTRENCGFYKTTEQFNKDQKKYDPKYGNFSKNKKHDKNI